MKLKKKIIINEDENANNKKEDLMKIMKKRKMKTY